MSFMVRFPTPPRTRESHRECEEYLSSSGKGTKIDEKVTHDPYLHKLNQFKNWVLYGLHKNYKSVPLGNWFTLTITIGMPFSPVEPNDISRGASLPLDEYVSAFIECLCVMNPLFQKGQILEIIAERDIVPCTKSYVMFNLEARP